MKKLALSLLLSTMMISTQTTPSNTTNLGPLQLVTVDGSNTFAAGTVNLFGNINIGQSTSDIITIQASGIQPGEGSIANYLMINSSGQMISMTGSQIDSTFGNLTAAGGAAETVTFGISGGSNNYFNLTSDSGNVTLQAGANSSNLNFSTNGNINFSGPQLLNINDANLLLLDANGNLFTSNSSTGPCYLGQLYTTGLNVINSLTTNSLTTGTSGGTVTLDGANIYLGGINGSTININGNSINTPSSGAYLLAIDSSNNLMTTDNSTAISCGNLTAGSLSGQTITLGNTNGTITLNATNLIQPSAGALNFLAIDSSNQLTTTNANTDLTVGNLTVAGNTDQAITVGSSLTDNNFFYLKKNAGDVSLFANAIGSNLNLSSTGHIKISSFDMTTPSAGENSLLIIDSSNNLSTASNTTNLQCGSLTAATGAGNTITLGIDDASHNYIYYVTDGGSMQISANSNGAFLELAANADINLTGTNLNLTFSNIAPVSNSFGNTVVATDRSGNLVTTNSSDIFILGSDTTGNNYISLDNSTTANGITLKTGALYLQDSSLIPASGYTNMLTIDSSGKIGIVVSTETRKQNIETLTLSNNDLSSLRPVSYQYKGNTKTEFGFIAEEIANIESLKNAVIYGKDGKIQSINYQDVFVALTTKHTEEIKKQQAALEEITQKYQQLEAIIEYLQNNISTK